VQRYHRERGVALVLSCSRRKQLREAITWIVLNPDGTHTVDGPDEFGFPLDGLQTFDQALPFARYGVPRRGPRGANLGNRD
jgi:hypothetical protein